MNRVNNNINTDVILYEQLKCLLITGEASRTLEMAQKKETEQNTQPLLQPLLADYHFKSQCLLYIKSQFK